MLIYKLQKIFAILVLPWPIYWLLIIILWYPALKLVDAIVDFCNKILLSGKVPKDLRPVFYSANLIVISKLDGGVRPITVRFTLRRRVGKILSKDFWVDHKAYISLIKWGIVL